MEEILCFSITLYPKGAAAGSWGILLTQLVNGLSDSESQEQNAAVSFGPNNPVNETQIVLLLQLVLRC